MKKVDFDYITTYFIILSLEPRFQICSTRSLIILAY